MEKCYFYENRLSNGFKFPKSFLDFVDKDEIPYLEPWYFLCKFKKNADFWLDEAKKQYPNRNLIPFSKDENTDDVSCFDGDDISGNPTVYFVHFFASEGWEDRGSVTNFEEWLKMIQEASKKYLIEMEEYE